jgi:hypothetical protein
MTDGEILTDWLEPRPQLRSGWRRLDAAIGDGPIPSGLLASCVQLVGRRVLLDVGDAEAAPDSIATTACLDLAEQFVMDVHGVRDDQVAAVRVHFGDAGVVQLVVALGLAEGAARAEALVGGDERGPR